MRSNTSVHHRFIWTAQAHLEREPPLNKLFRLASADVAYHQHHHCAEPVAELASVMTALLQQWLKLSSGDYHA
jgi:hypothetical protein